MNKLSIENELFIILFKLAQLAQFDLDLISVKLQCFHVSRVSLSPQG